MSLKKNKDLKLYFSISEVAQMFDVNESTLRFWEKEFDIINPRKTSKGTRFYKQEDIDAVRLIYHLVKERGMTLAGARQKLKDNKETTIRQEEIVNRLKQIKEELLKTHSMLLPRKCDYSVDKTRTKPYLRPQLNKT